MNAEILLQACKEAGVPPEVVAHIERYKDGIAAHYIAATAQPEPAGPEAEPETKPESE